MTSMEQQQRVVCARFGVAYYPAPDDLMLGLSKSVVEGAQPVNGLRHPPEGHTTGWYIWAGEEEISTDPETFEAIHVEHLHDICPTVLPYLGLPPGWRFLIAEGYEDVWEDPVLLNV